MIRAISAAMRDSNEATVRPLNPAVAIYRFEAKSKKAQWTVSSRFEAWTSYHTGEWVDLVHPVYLVYFVDLVQPNKQDKPNKPNEQERPADIFSFLLGIFN
jgi:hypothetical protein